MALPSRDFDAQPGDYTWEDWREEAKAAHPVRFFLSDTLPRLIRVRITMQIAHLWYWFRCHTYTRYHVLDLRSKEYGYKWGYGDPVEMVLIANFRILQNFVEKEHPDIGSMEVKDHADHDSQWMELIESQVKDEKEIRFLYDWWMITRPQLVASLRKAERRQYSELSDEIDRQDDEMLVRLMAVRRRLWT